VNKRDAFARIKNPMVNERLIEERSGFVWRLQQPGRDVFQYSIPADSTFKFTTYSVVAIVAVGRVYRPLRRFATLAVSQPVAFRRFATICDSKL
jgi:hypothetical protein